MHHDSQNPVGRCSRCVEPNSPSPAYFRQRSSLTDEMQYRLDRVHARPKSAMLVIGTTAKMNCVLRACFILKHPH